MSQETLIPIPELDFDPDYLANTKLGKIWSHKSGRYLDPKPNKRFGYCYTTVIIDGKPKPYSVHNLIMSAALGVKKKWWRDQGLEINHISDCPDTKSMNHIGNLELRTRKGQYDDECRSKLGKGRRLKLEEVRQILFDWREWQKDKENKFSAFCNLKKDEYGVSYSCIEGIVKRKTWKRIEI